MRYKTIQAAVLGALLILSPAVRADVETGAEEGSGKSEIEACAFAKGAAERKANSPLRSASGFKVQSIEIRPCQCGRTSIGLYKCVVEYGVTFDKK